MTNFRRPRTGAGILLTVLAVGMFHAPAVRAVILFGSGDPLYNTTAPTGNLAGSGWEIEGRWRGFLGTPIAPNLFITAKHVGGSTSDLFSFQGSNYVVIDSFTSPASDLRIFKICGIFPAFASLYTRSDELGKQMVVFGRGTQRGAEVQGATTGGTELKGWKWGPGDGVMRWGVNTVATTTGTIEGFGELLTANFDANAGADECHLSSGDSGGGIFIKDGATWKLAGINYAVDGPFNTTNSGPGFFAAVFDVGGLYETNSVTSTWDYTIPNPITDTPSVFYATRISSNLSWINSIINQESQSSYVPTVESTPDLNLPFGTQQVVAVDEQAKTITIALPPESLFLRLQGCMTHQIISTEIQGGNWIIHYGP